MPSSAAGMPPGNEGAGCLGLFDEGLDMVLKSDDEANVDKEPTGDELDIDPEEVQMLKQIIKPTSGSEPSTAPKSGDKWGSTHLDGSSGLSSEDLDASRGAWAKKKTSTPTKVSHPNQWSEDDIDIMHQIHYKMDLQRFQTYRTNKIDPTDLASINTKDHSTYLEVAQADPSSVIKKSIFSMAAYHATLKQQGGDTSKFNKEVGTNFKKGAKGSWAPDSEKVPIDWVMLVCQCENGVDIAYSDPDGFGCPGTMGLWDLHSTNALSRAKMLLQSGLIDANFCPLCFFWNTNNKTLNNHVRKHYRMGLTCRADRFTMATMAAMKAHMETEHGYKGKCGRQAKKAKGKG